MTDAISKERLAELIDSCDKMGKPQTGFIHDAALALRELQQLREQVRGLHEQIDLVARDMEILEKERDAALALSKISREDLETWWEQCTQGLFTDHGECPATYACSSILSDLRDIDPTLAAAQDESHE